MKTPLEPMFDNHVPVDEQGPAAVPRGEMVLEMDAVNVLELWRDLREACFKSGIVIPEQPNFSGDPGSYPDFAKALLADFELFLNRWARFPTDRWVPTNRGAVDSVSVAYYSDGFMETAVVDKSAMGD